MSANPVAALVAILDAEDIEASSEVKGRPATHVRLDEAGGTEQIRGYLDGALIEVQCFAPTTSAAAALGREVRAILTAAHGIVAEGIYVSKITTSPQRRHSGDRGHVSFPARVFLHPWPVAP